MPRERIERLLFQAERTVAAAERLLRRGEVGFAASRAYYGFLFLAQALLAAEGCGPTRHREIIAGYGEVFADTGRLDPRFHELLERAFRFRRLADYRDGEDLPPDEVEEVVRESRRFLVETRRELAGLDNPALHV